MTTFTRSTPHGVRHGVKSHRTADVFSTCKPKVGFSWPCSTTSRAAVNVTLGPSVLALEITGPQGAADPSSDRSRCLEGSAVRWGPALAPPEGMIALGPCNALSIGDNASSTGTPPASRRGARGGVRMRGRLTGRRRGRSTGRVDHLAYEIFHGSSTVRAQSIRWLRKYPRL